MLDINVERTLDIVCACFSTYLAAGGTPPFDCSAAFDLIDNQDEEDAMEFGAGGTAGEDSSSSIRALGAAIREAGRVHNISMIALIRPSHRTASMGGTKVSLVSRIGRLYESSHLTCLGMARSENIGFIIADYAAIEKETATFKDIGPEYDAYKNFSGE